MGVGIALIIGGFSVLIVAQVVLRFQIKKLKKEWNDNHEVS